MLTFAAESEAWLYGEVIVRKKHMDYTGAVQVEHLTGLKILPR